MFCACQPSGRCQTASGERLIWSLGSRTIEGTRSGARLPGKVFADPELDYVEAVQAFVKGSQPLFDPSFKAATVEKPSLRGELQRLCQEETLLCIERRNTRKRRELEDLAWRVTWQPYRTEKPSTQEITNPKLRARWGSAKCKNNSDKICANNIVS